jgi:hypothetical protein
MKIKSNFYCRSATARLLFAGGFVAAVEGGAMVKVQVIHYHGWKDAVEISNRDAKLVVVP